LTLSAASPFLARDVSVNFNCSVMTKVFRVVEVGDEDLVPAVRKVLSMEVLFWILSVVLALGHVALQSATDKQFADIVTSAHINGSNTDESAFVAVAEDYAWPNRGPMQGAGGMIFAGIVSFIGLVAVTACLAQSIRGLRVLGADGDPRKLRMVFYCEMLGTVFTLLFVLAAFNTGLWYSDAKGWTAKETDFCQQAINASNTSSVSLAGNVTTVAACKGAVANAGDVFGTASIAYFIFLAALIPIVFLCGCSARVLYKMNPNMIATGSIEAAVQRVRRSSIDAPVIGPLVRRISHSQGHGRQSRERQNDYAIPQTVGKEGEQNL